MFDILFEIIVYIIAVCTESLEQYWIKAGNDFNAASARLRLRIFDYHFLPKTNFFEV